MMATLWKVLLPVGAVKVKMFAAVKSWTWYRSVLPPPVPIVRAVKVHGQLGTEVGVVWQSVELTVVVELCTIMHTTVGEPSGFVVLSSI